MPTDPFQIPTAPAVKPGRQPHRDATCPTCGRDGVPVRSGRVGVHAPARVRPSGQHYIAEAENCAGVGDVPEYARSRKGAE